MFLHQLVFLFGLPCQSSEEWSPQNKQLVIKSNFSQISGEFMDWILPLPLCPRVTAETLGSYSLPSSTPGGPEGFLTGWGDAGQVAKPHSRAGGSFPGIQESIEAEVGGGSRMKSPVAALQASLRLCPRRDQARFLEQIPTPDLRRPMPPDAYTLASPIPHCGTQLGFLSRLAHLLPPELSFSFPRSFAQSLPSTGTLLVQAPQDAELGLALELPSVPPQRTPFLAWVLQLSGLKGAPVQPPSGAFTVLHGQGPPQRPTGLLCPPFSLCRLLLLLEFVLLPIRIWFEQRGEELFF